MNDGTVVDYSSTADVRISIMVDVRLTSSGVSDSKRESNPKIRAHQPEMDLGHREGGLSARPPLKSQLTETGSLSWTCIFEVLGTFNSWQWTTHHGMECLCSTVRGT